jgi:Porin PorA
MRRGTVVYLLLGIGVFLLVLAPLLRFYVHPRVAKLPLDPYSVTQLTGTGATYLDRSNGQTVTGAPITAWNETRGDIESGTKTRMVWGGQTTVLASDGQSLPTVNANGEVVDLVNPITRTRVPMDRKTAAAIACCGEQPTGHNGSLTFNFPMGTERKTYPYWDDSAGRAAPVEFVRSTKLGGLEVYEFTGTVPLTKVQSLEVPGTVVNRPQQTVLVDQYYENLERRVWVEPDTGAIVKAATHPSATLRDQTTAEKLATVFEVRLEVVEAIPASVRAQARANQNNPDLDEALSGSVDLRERAEDGASKLRLVGTTLPLVALLLGIALIVVAGLLLLTRRPPGQHRVRTTEPDDTYDPVNA